MSLDLDALKAATFDLGKAPEIISDILPNMPFRPPKSPLNMKFSLKHVTINDRPHKDAIRAGRDIYRQ